MKISLPSFEKLDVNQSTAALSVRSFEACSQLILLLPKGERASVPEHVPLSSTLNARLKRGAWRKPPAHIVVELSNHRSTRVVVGFVDPGVDAFQRLTCARKLISVLRQEPATEIAFAFDGLGDTTADWAEALVTAAGAADFRLATFRKQEEPARILRSVRLLGMPKRLDLDRTLAGIQGNNLARWLSALPGNVLRPASYRRMIATLAKRHGWSVETLDRSALQKKGCGAFLAVVQASENKDAAIVRLRYRPAKAKSKKGVLALVGKGLCYDTGGVNLKPARYMFGMHEDMMGSAVALGSLLALSELQVPFAVDCWLALAENHIGPRAYQPNDVITACDGTTIEIVHTDAEGRMVLADTLALVAKSKPSLVLDYATLTGSCVQALGTRYSGVFSNRPGFHDALVTAGKRSGERVWPFPQDADYDEMIESKVADIRQCSQENEADHILGARFLSRFIGKDIPWVHMDLSAGNAKGGLGAIATETTGFGVRVTLESLLGESPLPY